MTYYEFLKQELRLKAVKHGDFTLSAGGKSKYLIQACDAIMSGQVINTLGVCLLNEINPVTTTCVGGPAIGALPMAFAYNKISGCDTFYFRDGVITGHVITPDSRVTVFEDVITTGASVMKCCREIERLGGTVEKVVALVDREEGFECPYPYAAIFKAKELL